MQKMNGKNIWKPRLLKKWAVFTLLHHGLRLSDTSIRLNSPFVGFCHMIQGSPIGRTTFGTWWLDTKKCLFLCSKRFNQWSDFF